MHAPHVDVLLRCDPVAVGEARHPGLRFVDGEDRGLGVAVDLREVAQARLDAQPSVGARARVTKVPRPRCGETRPSRSRRAIATRTVTRATRNSSTSCSNENPLRTELCPPLARLAHGRIRLDERPGLGVEPDLEALRALCAGVR
jgi:hypothetical protein